VSAATKSSRRRMGITTLISSIFIVASLVWATYNFVIVQSGAVRQYDPHYEYDEIPYWPYDNDIVGGRTNWFDNVNYTDVLIDEPLPDDILDHLDDVIFTVAPADPPPASPEGVGYRSRQIEIFQVIFHERCIGVWLIFGFVVRYHHWPEPSIMID